MHINLKIRGVFKFITMFQERIIGQGLVLMIDNITVVASRGDCILVSVPNDTSDPSVAGDSCGGDIYKIYSRQAQHNGMSLGMLLSDYPYQMVSSSASVEEIYKVFGRLMMDIFVVQTARLHLCIQRHGMEGGCLIPSMRPPGSIRLPFVCSFKVLSTGC